MWNFQHLKALWVGAVRATGQQGAKGEPAASWAGTQKGHLPPSDTPCTCLTPFHWQLGPGSNAGAFIWGVPLAMSSFSHGFPFGDESRARYAHCAYCPVCVDGVGWGFLHILLWRKSPKPRLSKQVLLVWGQGIHEKCSPPVWSFVVLAPRSVRDGVIQPFFLMTCRKYMGLYWFSSFQRRAFLFFNLCISHLHSVINLLSLIDYPMSITNLSYFMHFKASCKHQFTS